MNTDTTASCPRDGLHGALLSGFVNVAEDGSLCFVSDRMYRACPHCGTVFVGSAWRVALAGPQGCPFCGREGTVPMLSVAGVA
jgi:hypothetical protein